MKNNEDSSSSEIIEPNTINISDKYTDIEPLPSTGFNSLYKAKRYGKWFILKGLKPEFQQQTMYKTLLTKEFELGIGLDHQNIVKITDKEEINDLGLCIIMEYIDGCDLTEFLASRPSKKIRKKVLLEIIDALQYIHSKQLIHRDLKPGNIIITHNGNNAKLIDFGLGDTDYYAELKQPAGTLKYAAPEQLNAETKIDGRADIYSLGCIISLMFGNGYKKIASTCKQTDRENRYDNAIDVKNAIIKNDRRWKILLSIVLIATALIIIGTERIASHKKLESVEHTQQEVKQLIVELMAKEQNVQGNGGDCFLVLKGSYKTENKNGQNTLSVKVQRNKTKLPFKKKGKIYSYADKSEKTKSYYKAGFVLEALDKNGNVIYSAPAENMENSIDSLITKKPNDIFDITWNIDPSKMSQAIEIRIRFVFEYEFVRNKEIDTFLDKMEQYIAEFKKEAIRLNNGDLSTTYDIIKTQEKIDKLVEPDQEEMTKDQKERYQKVYNQAVMLNNQFF